MKKKSILKSIVKMTFLGGFVCSLLVFGMCNDAKADTVWEPDNDFYAEHARKCDFEGDAYQTNAKEGYITVYEAPNSGKEVGKIKNCKSFYVGFSWTDKRGVKWGVLDLWGYEPEKGELLAETESGSGWVLMKDMAAIYNEGNFRIEHQAELTEYSDEMQGYEIENGIQLWEYPGAAEPIGEIKSYMSPGDEPSYDMLYTDEEGRRWTHIGYYYIQKGWVCIDEPEAKELSGTKKADILADEIYPPADAEGELHDETKENMKLAIIPVVAVVVVTAIVIVIFFGKKKKEDKK